VAVKEVGAMQIAGRPIGPEHPPYIIAELSGNHGGSLQRALEIVDAVAEADVDALKLQTYTADTMTLDVDRDEFIINEPSSLWYGRRLHELYAEAHTPWEWHEEIFARANERGLVAFSAPFDTTAVEFLESLDVPCHKIASFESTDLNLVRAVAQTGKPTILSTGLATAAEISAAVEMARASGCEDLLVLKCSSAYPTSPKDSNLATIPHLRALTGCEVGLSDHTLGVGVPVAAVALGAVAVEKHVTLSRDDDTVDAAFSLEPTEFAQLVVEARQAWEAVGTVRYGPTEDERRSLWLRRSLYAVEDIPIGGVVTRANVRSIRPSYGLPTIHLDDVIGLRVQHEVPRGTPLSWELFR
jgi:pseudaminic acid synthase